MKKKKVSKKIAKRDLEGLRKSSKKKPRRFLKTVKRIYQQSPKSNSYKKNSRQPPAKGNAEKKFEYFVDVGNLEELNYLINLLDPHQIEKFMHHYKEKKHPKNVEDFQTYKVVTTSKDYKELIERLKEGLGEKLISEYDDLKKEISDIRKKGGDVLIEDLKLSSVPLKIKLFKATMEKKDFYKIKKILKEVKDEINEVKKIILKKEEEITKSKSVKEKFEKKDQVQKENKK